MSAHDPDIDPAGASYLWDRQGEPSPEILAMERELASLRHRPSPLIFVRPVNHSTPIAGARGVRQRLPLRAAAMLTMVIGAAWLLSLISSARQGEHARTQGSMEVVAVQGEPKLANRSLAGQGVLRPGQWIETDRDSQARIRVGGLGSVSVEAGSRVRLVHARPTEQRLELAVGSISAVIAAPPRLFVVDTPAAAAVDLGCAYRMTVDDQGNGIIEVTRGWVSMEPVDGGAVASIVPSGAMCLTRKGRDPGTPFQSDAVPALIRALERFDFDGGSSAALDVVLAESREEDSVTLWHLLTRTHSEARARVFDRLTEFAPLPPGVSRRAIMLGDESALLAWRDAFNWSPTPPTSPILDVDAPGR